MKINNTKQLVLALSWVFVSQTSFASAPVKWVGVVQEKGGFHTTNHDNGHDLEFVRQTDNESFDVIDNEVLGKIHAEKDKKLLVEVSGELTNRFLFWGGNLIVKDVKVIDELEPIEHKEQVVQRPLSTGDIRR